ncbi:MAG: DUF3450 domain-containing protein [Geobacteraceae bacterium]|nr:DUF3450 domain-containing protein [Geobacteraceae bacterium]
MKIYVLMVVLLLCTLRVEARTLAQDVAEPLHDSIAMQQRSQEELDAWEREKTALLQEFETLLQRREKLKNRNARLEEQKKILAHKIAQSKQAMIQARELGQEMEPFLRQSADMLDVMLEDSMPFYLEEREARIRQLHEEVWAADVPVAEQFRHLMQVLKSEYDYAHSVDVRAQELEIEGERVFMSQLRIGNLALFALSLDQQRCAHYDPVSREWRWLDPRWSAELTKAVAMGNKQRPVDLLTLPFGRLEQQR